MITRRALMTSAALAGTARALGVGAAPAAAEPPPETTTLKIAMLRSGLICQAPLYVAEELLPAGGFTEVQYVPQETDVGIRRAVASGEAHVGMAFSPPTHDPGDTVRFFSLRLHEAGMIKSSPQKIIAQGTD
jgi:NitT/TauT family transport system substrate-binding protein